LQADAAANNEAVEVEQVAGWCSKPAQKGTENILATREWNVKQTSCHGGDVLGNECPRDKMKALSLDELEARAWGMEQAKREVTKGSDILAKCLLLFDGFPLVLRTNHKDLTPERENKNGKSWQHGKPWSSM
jgi:hypothetical protein